MKKNATLSPCGQYRYWLERWWGDEGKPSDYLHYDFLNWVMLNPSTADATIDDQTIRKCIEFSKRWGYAGLHVTNLFALRSTNPDVLRLHADPVGPHNDDFIESGRLSAPITIVAWGSNASAGERVVRPRASEVLAKLGPVFCLGVNKDGSPKHPCYLPHSTPLVKYRPIGGGT